MNDQLKIGDGIDIHINAEVSLMSALKFKTKCGG